MTSSLKDILTSPFFDLWKGAGNVKGIIVK